MAAKCVFLCVNFYSLCFSFTPFCIRASSEKCSGHQFDFGVISLVVEDLKGELKSSNEHYQETETMISGRRLGQIITNFLI